MTTMPEWREEEVGVQAGQKGLEGRLERWVEGRKKNGPSILSLVRGGTLKPKIQRYLEGVMAREQRRGVRDVELDKVVDSLSDQEAVE